MVATRSDVQITSGSLRLEGVLYAPDAPASAAVVVCHPHPQRGGDMHNNVVMTVARVLVESGIAALTFNFRGVGASQGAYDDGAGEQDDVRSALSYARALAGVERVGLAGYSFGAGMAATVVDDTVAALALVSAPAARLKDSTALSSFKGPVLMTAGDLDNVASLEAMEAAAAQRSGPVEVVMVPGVDHFWRGHEGELAAIVGPFFAKALG